MQTVCLKYSEFPWLLKFKYSYGHWLHLQYSGWFNNQAAAIIWSNTVCISDNITWDSAGCSSILIVIINSPNISRYALSSPQPHLPTTVLKCVLAIWLRGHTLIHVDFHCVNRQMIPFFPKIKIEFRMCLLTQFLPIEKQLQNKHRMKTDLFSI